MKEKKVKRTNRKKSEAPVPKNSGPSIWAGRVSADLLYLAFLLLATLLAFWSLTVDSRIYTQGDNINDAVYYNQVNQYYQQTGEIARWNPYIFGGVPNIFNLPKSVFTPDYYLEVISKALSLPFVFFWLGAVGLYFLLRHLQFDRLQSLFGSLLFVLAPFYKSLVINGHGTKIQAIMYAPWVLLALFRLCKDLRWFDVLFLALVAGLQIRTSHYQVVFYTAIIAFIFVAWDMAGRFRERSGLLLPLSVKLVVAGALTLMISARPLLLAANYAGESIRGREVVRLNDAQPDGRTLEKGVSKRFVSNWSFTPSELMTLLVSRAKGGTSNEYYSAARSIGFRDQVIPGYWGHSPYNGSYYYLGSITFLLLLVAFSWLKKNPLLWPLGIALLLMIVWSLGTFAGPIYDISYSVIPFFANFRTPTTSLAMVYLLAAIAATYGLRSLLYFDTKSKKTWQVMGFAAGLVILLFIIGNSASFMNERQSYQANILEMLVEARRGMYFTDLGMLFGGLLAFGGVLWLLIRKMIDPRSAMISLLLLSAIDLLLVSNRYSDETVSRAEFNRTFLGESQTTSFLKNDQEVFRVFVLGNMNFGLPAHVQTIGGGYDMQMNQSLYELTNNNLYERIDGTNQINWNVLDFMNVKYMVSDRQLEDDHLSQEIVDPGKGLYTYRYKFNKSRGFFVDGYQVLKDPVARMRQINNPNFDARRTAILEETPKQQIFPASRSTVELISFDPNKIVYTVQTANPGLFVMSDIYQPTLQKVFLDGELVEDVYKTNHAIQSIVVPEGLHTIEIRFDESMFTLSQWVTNSSFSMIYLFFLFMGYQYLGKRRNPLSL